MLCRYEQKLHIATSHSSRFTGLTVGTDFDPKELMFRNYLGLISQESKIAARITFSEGEKDDKEVYTIGWLDPSGRLVGKNKLQVAMSHKCKYLNWGKKNYKNTIVLIDVISPGERHCWHRLSLTKLIAPPPPRPLDRASSPSSASC